MRFSSPSLQSAVSESREGGIVLRCARGTRFHTVIAKRENVIMVQINQNPVQKLFKKCTVVLWLCGESRSRYKVKGLKLSEGREILSELC